MLNIDYIATSAKAREFLDTMTDYLLSGCYQVKKVQLFEITEDTQFQDLVMVKKSTKYDDVIFDNLEIISRMHLETKRILYCVHMLGIKRRNLQSSCEPIEYSFGRSFETYKKSLIEFGLTQERFIVYQ